MVLKVALLALWIGTFQMLIYFLKPSKDEKAYAKAGSEVLQNCSFESTGICYGETLVMLDQISKNEYDVLERSKGICYGGISGVLKIALLALLVSARMRRAFRNSQIQDIYCDGREQRAGKGREGNSISLYILPPPDRPHLMRPLVIIIIIILVRDHLKKITKKK